MRASPAGSRSTHWPSGGAHAHEEIVGLRSASDAVIYPHVFANADREVGGVLVGRTPLDGGLPLVTGAIPALSADEQRATLTFTQEAWAHVHRTLECDFPPDEQIVGWYHSHPGFGIFLSGHDLFIHENFFSSPSQIAVVVDPHARTEGVFVWREAELAVLLERATPGRWVAAAALPEPRAGDGTVARAGHSSHSARDGYPLLALAIVGLLGVLIGFGIWSLAEGSSGAGAPRAGRSQPGVTVRSRPAREHTSTAAQSHIEVLGE